MERGTTQLPEVVRLRDARGERPRGAVGAGGFWYEPEIWRLPLSPTARVLYAGLCAFLGHGEINRQDLRATLKDHSDVRIASALEELARHRLLAPMDGIPPMYEVRRVGEFAG